MTHDEIERRVAPRLARPVPVRYKFISGSIAEKVDDRVHEGKTVDISLGGLMLVGAIPNLDWLKGLLVGRIHIGVNMALPGSRGTVKALCALSWIDAMDATARMTRLGLRIVEMPAEHRKVLGDFLAEQHIGS